jgi:hypothetical protein
MALSTSDNLMFYPLYFIFHDQWHFQTWTYNTETGWLPHLYDHRGHMHFFMLGHNAFNNGQAYRGQQKYHFTLTDDWSPRVTDDPNQTQNIEIIGTPRWYFWIREFWRRVYIQYWDDPDNPVDGGNHEKLGIKYDASLPIHTYGPYREGKDNFFYNVDLARTLPVEYYRNTKLSLRDHWIRNTPGDPHNGQWNWDEDAFDDYTEWIIPRTVMAGVQDNHPVNGNPLDNPARRFGYNDSNYIYPTIEYQYYQHLDWERLPGWEERDVDSTTFGDGFELEVTIPFKDENDIIQSPFSDDDGNVGSPGSYYHNFESKHPDRVLRYPSEDLSFESNVLNVVRTNDPGGHNVVYDSTEWLIPPSLKGQKASFHVPSQIVGNEDGVWVEQCLGAIVKARAKVTIKDNFGGQYDVWVNSSQFMVQDDFEGSDQNESA